MLTQTAMFVVFALRELITLGSFANGDEDS